MKSTRLQHKPGSKFFMILMILLSMVIWGSTALAFAGESVSDQETIVKAIKEAADGGEQTIKVKGTITVDETIEIPAGKKIRITTEDGEGILKGKKHNSYIFHVQEGGTLILDGGVTLTEGMYVKCNGAFVMEDAVLSNVSISSSSMYNGAVSIEGNHASFTMNGGVIEKTRSYACYGGVVKIAAGATGTINGGSIRNNEICNQLSGSLFLYNGGSCVMNKGEIKGNIAKNQLQASGGVMVLALDNSAQNTHKGQEARFTMNGGIIEGNESPYGGGVYVYGGNFGDTRDLFSKAYFTMNGGTIKGNKATGSTTSRGEFTGGGGGGIYVEAGGECVMNDGIVTGNSVQGKGGGVATYDTFLNATGGRKIPFSTYKGYKLYGRDIGTWPEFFPAAFTMNGGTIADNHAKSSSSSSENGCGGGIYCASNGVALHAGNIKNNDADRQGGGVYVGSVPYVLHMYDCLIKGNEASLIGGGAWFCPTGDMEMYINSGSAIYDNKGKTAADDLAVVHTNQSHSATLSDRILGGGKTNWYEDGKLELSSMLGYADPSGIRYQKDSDKNIAVSGVVNHKEALSLKSVPKEYAKKQAEASAKLFITGNSSLRGGGIGSNGSMILGKSYEATEEFSVQKVWKSDEKKTEPSIPESVTIWLVAEDGTRVDKAVLSEKNGWKYTFEGLPADVNYKIEEEKVDDWQASYEIKEDTDGEVHAVVTNTYAPKDPPGSENAKDPQDPQNSQGSRNPGVGTGDKSSPLLWGMIAATALLCGAGAFMYRRKTMK